MFNCICETYDTILNTYYILQESLWTEPKPLSSSLFYYLKLVLAIFRFSDLFELRNWIRGLFLGSNELPLEVFITFGESLQRGAVASFTTLLELVRLTLDLVVAFEVGREVSV